MTDPSMPRRKSPRGKTVALLLGARDGQPSHLRLWIRENFPVEFFSD